MKKNLKLNLFGKKCSFNTMKFLIVLFLGILTLITFSSNVNFNKSISHVFTEKMKAQANSHLANAYASAADASYQSYNSDFSKNDLGTKIFGQPFTTEGLHCGKNKRKDSKSKDNVEGFRNMDEQDMEGVEGNYVSSLTYDIGDSINHFDTYNKVSLPIKSVGGFFDENKFSKNCNSMYSNSMGMACITKEQLEYLDQHGGNRTMGEE